MSKDALREPAPLPAEALPNRSQRMRDAGFTARDRRLTCDECGAKFTAQFAPLHECATPAYCQIHQHHKWCEHNGGVMGPTGYEAPQPELSRPEIKQIIYALERAEKQLRASADRLHEAHDYSAEFPAEDADRMREAMGLLRALDVNNKGTTALCSAVTAILDGEDTGEGVCLEPWESMRRRLLAIVGAKSDLRKDLPRVELSEPDGEGLTDALVRLWPLIERGTKGFVFTAAKAGEVAADMATLRDAVLASRAAGEKGKT
jgi:hypothetical protein